MTSTPGALAPTDPSASSAPIVQLLTPEGERVTHPDYALELTDDEYRSLYRDLVLVRRVDLEATALQRQGELGIYISLLGQEAAQIGSGRALRHQDYVFPSYREHGVAWCRDVDPVDVIAFMRGTVVGGAWDPVRHRFFMYQIVIGTQTLHATGYAMGVQRDGRVGSEGDDNEAVITYFGDGATSQGDVNEAFVWAGVNNAPVVFFCQNNQWGISTRSTTQSRIPIYLRAGGFGFPGVRVDGNDVLASLAVTRAALDHARSGNGPTLIEAFTYRMGAHTTSDDPSRYRLNEELEAWKLKDPLERMKAFLHKQLLADSSFFEALEAEADALAADVRQRTLALQDPPAASMFEHVYEDQTPLLLEQQAAFMTYHDGFADQ